VAGERPVLNMGITNLFDMKVYDSCVHTLLVAQHLSPTVLHEHPQSRASCRSLFKNAAIYTHPYHA
jgi:hypothetical protein